MTHGLTVLSSSSGASGTGGSTGGTESPRRRFARPLSSASSWPKKSPTTPHLAASNYFLHHPSSPTKRKMKKDECMGKIKKEDKHRRKKTVFLFLRQSLQYVVPVLGLFQPETRRDSFPLQQTWRRLDYRRPRARNQTDVHYDEWKQRMY